MDLIQISTLFNAALDLVETAQDEVEDDPNLKALAGAANKNLRLLLEEINKPDEDIEAPPTLSPFDDIPKR